MATPDPAFYRHPCRSHIGRRIMNDEEIEGEIDRRINKKLDSAMKKHVVQVVIVELVVERPRCSSEILSLSKRITR